MLLANYGTVQSKEKIRIHNVRPITSALISQTADLSAYLCDYVTKMPQYLCFPFWYGEVHI